MEATIRKKHIKKDLEGKITIKHYLNIKLKSLIDEEGYDSFCYPIYTRITVLRQTIEIKSRVNNSYCEKEDFPNHISKYSESFECEKNTLTNIIKAGKPFENQKFDLKKSIKIYNNLTMPLAYLIDKLLFNQICKLIPYTPIEHDSITIFGSSNLPDSYFNEDKTLKIDCLVKNDKNSDILKNALRNTFETKKGFKAKESIILCCLVYSHIDNNDFVDLYNKYNFLWEVKNSIGYEVRNSMELTEDEAVEAFCYDENINAIEWFSTKNIQNEIRNNHNQYAESIINQISDILTKFDFAKNQDTPSFLIEDYDDYDDYDMYR